MTYSEVGTHSQNGVEWSGVTETGISTVVNSARIMMLHQALLRSKQFGIRMYPFDLSHAEYLCNVIPNRVHEHAPIEIYAGTRMKNKNLRSEKTWGCPAYILDPKLQDGKKLPSGFHELDEDNTWVNHLQIQVQ